MLDSRLFVNFPAHGATTEVVAVLRAILEAHPGTSPVSVGVGTQNIRLNAAFNVDITYALTDALLDALGDHISTIEVNDPPGWGPLERGPIVVGEAGRSANEVANRFRLGAVGEVATAKALQQLLVAGYSIFHDLLAPSGGNIDHVVVGPGGVFLVDSTVARDSEAKARQVRVAATRLAARLRSAAGISVVVKPMVANPLFGAREGIGIRVLDDGGQRPVMVGDGFALVGWIMTQRETLEADSISALQNALLDMS